VNTIHPRGAEAFFNNSPLILASLAFVCTFIGTVVGGGVRILETDLVACAPSYRLRCAHSRAQPLPSLFRSLCLLMGGRAPLPLRHSSAELSRASPSPTALALAAPLQRPSPRALCWGWSL
jgi:O-antigen ligase